MRWVTAVLICALAACSDRTVAPIVPAAATIGQNTIMLISTPRTLNVTGEFLRGRSGAATFGLDQL